MVLRYVASFLAGAAVASGVILVGGVGQTDCTEVRDEYRAYQREVQNDQSLMSDMLALAENDPECFGETEPAILGVPRDNQPALPDD